MKILVSAYACEPNKGSEPGVGWGWVIEIAKHHEVWVITRENNEKTINNYIDDNPDESYKNIKFIYVGISKLLTFWKKGNRGIRLFYTLWQWEAAKIAIELNEEQHFDLVHHVTFVSFTQVTFMYKLGIPMIWGPIAGGEIIPEIIKIEMDMREIIHEGIRKLSQKVSLFIPSISKTMKFSQYILVATDETKLKIPKKYWHKVIIIPAIGLTELPLKRSNECSDEKIRIIMAGKLIHLKAFDIGIKAFLEIVDRYPNVELHILGEGIKKTDLMKLSSKYLDSRIFFEPPVQHNDIYSFFSKFDIFLNTSLRDSGCMTLMEAMSVGLPCLAIATGGPKVLLNEYTDCLIQPQEYQKCIYDIADKLVKLVENHEYRNQISNSLFSHCSNNLTYMSKMKMVCELYDKSISRTSHYDQ